MVAHPIDTVIVDNVLVNKTAFRSFIHGRTELVLTAASEITTMVLTGTVVVVVNGQSFYYDSSDTTSSHDGISVLVDASTPTARRYKATLGIRWDATNSRTAFGTNNFTDTIATVATANRLGIFD